MSDERDETRRSAPSGDAAPSDPPSDPPGDPAADASRPGDPRLDQTMPGDPRLDDTLPGDSRLDDTLPGDSRLDEIAPGDDAAGATAKLPPVDDATRVAGPRPDATSVLPPVEDDWAPSRANPAWSGRAEVRAPRPERYADEWSGAPAPEPGGRWWMPIVVGTVILILLGVLGWAIYLIVQNSGDDETPGPVTTTSAVPTATTTRATTPPTTTPTTSMITTPPTTDPTTTEIVVPALKGLSEQEAVGALDRKGLAYRVIYLDDQPAPPGTVIDSDPAEGQEVPPDTRITLVVSSSRTATTTPTTTGSSAGPGAGTD